MSTSNPGVSARLVMAGALLASACSPERVSTASPVQSVVGGVRSADHQERIAFSPDGRWLASGADGELIIWAVGEAVTEVNRSALGEERLTALGFSGDRLVVVTGTAAGLGAIRQFLAPAWTEGRRIGLGAVVPSMLRAHPSRARAATGLLGGASWNPRKPAEKGYGAVVYDLDSGLPIGGAGPVSGTSLVWSGDDMAAVDLGSLRRYTTANREMAVLRAIPEASSVSQLFWDGEREPLVGWDSPPRAGWLADGAAAPTPLGPDGAVLYQLAPAWGGRAVAVVVNQDIGNVIGVDVLVLGRGGIEASWSLPWPLAGVAAHPDRPLLAWQDRAGAVRLLSLTDGAEVLPEARSPGR